ncbi:MAG: lipase maturation factor family protein [Candidatus Nanosalina sp.]
MTPFFDPVSYWWARFLFLRGLAFTYLLAFICVKRQYIPLLGENGITPFTEFTDRVDFWESPSLFFFLDSDRFIEIGAWLGILLSTVALLGLPQQLGTGITAAVFLMLWTLYLSYVNVGRIFYGFGWESMLTEAGFLAVFLGASGTATPDLVIWLIRWMLFRVMFGAGLIKLRGDDTWNNLTALNYHYETQPMPNPLSHFLHNMPEKWHKFETAATHFIQLVVPLFFFAPQPFAAIAGLLTIGFHLVLMIGGNYSWLNSLSIVLCFSLFSDSMMQQFLSLTAPAVTPVHPVHQVALLGYTALVVGLSYYSVRNMASENQRMNSSFEPLKLVNTYGAFGSVTRKRYEVVVEGKDPDTGEWKEYGFYGKPTDTEERPPQVAPYHLRLDWQMWFAAMSPRPRRRWFRRFMHKLAENDRETLKLLEDNPLPENGPEKVRAKRYVYRFTDLDTWRETGEYWEREEVKKFFPSISGD